MEARPSFKRRQIMRVASTLANMKVPNEVSMPEVSSLSSIHLASNFTLPLPAYRKRLVSSWSNFLKSFAPASIWSVFSRTRPESRPRRRFQGWLWRHIVNISKGTKKTQKFKRCTCAVLPKCRRNLIVLNQALSINKRNMYQSEIWKFHILTSNKKP